MNQISLNEVIICKGLDFHIVKELSENLRVQVAIRYLSQYIVFLSGSQCYHLPLVILYCIANVTIQVRTRLPDDVFESVLIIQESAIHRREDIE